MAANCSPRAQEPHRRRVCAAAAAPPRPCKSATVVAIARDDAREPWFGMYPWGCVSRGCSTRKVA